MKFYRDCVLPVKQEGTPEKKYGWGVKRGMVQFAWTLKEQNGRVQPRTCGVIHSLVLQSASEQDC